jgi:hypothetical protein
MNVVMAQGTSAEAFAAAVIDTLQRDQRERIARGHTIADSYDWRRVGGRILDVFHSVAGRSAQSSGAHERAVA